MYISRLSQDMNALTQDHPKWEWEPAGHEGNLRSVLIFTAIGIAVFAVLILTGGPPDLGAAPEFIG